MSVNVTPHLNFRGDAREALEFYGSVVGAEPTVVTFADAGAVQDPAEAQQVIWGQVESADGFRVMAFDVPSSRAFDRGLESFFVALRGTDADEVTRYWEGLSQGATVLQAFGPSQWSPLYGMLRDRFGITWVIDQAVEYDAG